MEEEDQVQISDFLKLYGLEPLSADSAIFIGQGISLGLFVDDIIIVGPDMKKINDLKAALNGKFKMTDLGPCKYYLGMTVERNREKTTLQLGQEDYLDSVVWFFE